MFFSKKRSNARKSFRQNKCLPSAIPGHDLANRRHLLRLEPLEDRRMLSVLHVDVDALPGGDGAAWGSAYDDLQGALTQAAALNSDTTPTNDIDQIWIADGTYLPSGELEAGDIRSASFSMVDGVTLYGGFEGTEAALGERDLSANVTTLSGDLGIIDDNSDNAYTVVYCGAGIETAIDGLTVTGGNANGNVDSNHPEKIYGGGVYNGGTLTVTNSTLSDNTASRGGGIYNDGTLTVTGSTISENLSEHYGGGIYNYGTLTVTGSTISGNSASYAGDYIFGGGIYNYGTLTVTGSTISENLSEHYGGGIYNYRGTLTVTDSTISGNSVIGKYNINGGGIYNNNGTLTITNSTIFGNSAGGGGSGGIYNDGTLTVTSSTILGNSAGYGGGGISNGDGILTITNSTISGNSAGRDGGGIYSYSSSSVTTLNNTIVAGNVAPSDPDINGNGTISGSHNLIGDGTGQDGLVNGIDGNIVGTASSPIDPMFSDWTQLANGQWGYYLLSGSPAIDSGDNSLAVDAAGQPLTEDIYGNPRIVNSTVDIGAVEGATAPGIAAQTYLVTSLDETIANDGILTFIEAFEAAQSNQPVGDASGGSYSEQDIIQFADSLSGTILVDDGQLLIFGDLSIEGPGEGLITFDATGQNRVFSINPNVSVALSGITVTGGSAKGSGGGIYNYGTLTVTGSIISGNSAEGDDSKGGGIYNNGGTLTVTDSTISGNSVIGKYNINGGGIYNNNGTLTITNSTIFGNSAGGGGGGGIYNDGTLTVTSSTILGNSAGYGGGGFPTETAY